MLHWLRAIDAEEVLRHFFLMCPMRAARSVFEIGRRRHIKCKLIYCSAPPSSPRELAFAARYLCANNQRAEAEVCCQRRLNANKRSPLCLNLLAAAATQFSLLIYGVAL
jgi:hypothetical protein